MDLNGTKDQGYILCVWRVIILLMRANCFGPARVNIASCDRIKHFDLLLPPHLLGIMF